MKTKQIISYEVGKPLYGQNALCFIEGPIFDFHQSGGILKIFFIIPKPKEIIDISEGDIKFGLLYKKDIVFLFMKFGEQNWMDMPYSVHLSEDFHLDPIADENLGYALLVVLIDSFSGIVKVIRQVAMPNKMSNEFRIMLEKQKETYFNRNMYDENISQIYARYRTPELLKEATIYKQTKI
jgi:hypothetical protein